MPEKVVSCMVDIDLHTKDFLQAKAHASLNARHIVNTSRNDPHHGLRIGCPNYANPSIDTGIGRDCSPGFD